MTLRASWNGQPELSIEAAEPGWRKWSPSDPIPAHWYDADRFERLIAANIAHDQDTGRNMLVREFVGTFRGLSGSAKQKALLDKIGAARLSLADFFAEGRNRDGIAGLLDEMQKLSKPVKPADLGMIGSANLAARFKAAGADPDSFNYSKQLGVTDGLPWAAEVAFGLRHEAKARRLTTGVNFSPGIINPFRSLGSVGQSPRWCPMMTCLPIPIEHSFSAGGFRKFSTANSLRLARATSSFPPACEKKSRRG